MDTLNLAGVQSVFKKWNTRFALYVCKQSWCCLNDKTKTIGTCKIYMLAWSLENIDQSPIGGKAVSDRLLIEENSRVGK